MNGVLMAISKTGAFVLSFVLFAVGLGLVGLEVFIPSGGAISVAAAASIIVGIVFGFLYSSTLGVILILCALIVVPLLVWYLFKILPHTSIGKRLILDGPSNYEDVAAVPEKKLKDLVGRLGVVVSKLRPVGIAEIEGKRYQVVSEGMMVETGTKVRVIDVSGNRILVRVINEDEDTRTITPE